MSNNEIEIKFPRKPNGMRYRFMIVDDSTFIAKNLKRIIEKFKGDVKHVATNGKQAIELIKKYPGEIDIITLDIAMPEMDGIEALKCIVTIEPKIKVIMITARSFIKIVKEAIMIGAKDFIVKPFKEDIIYEKIKTIIDLDSKK